MVVKDPKNFVKESEKIKIKAEEEDFKLVLMPRYDEFRDLAIEMAKEDVQFREVSGNDEILLTAIGKKGDYESLKITKIVGTSKVVTHQDEERILVLTPIFSLSETLNKLIENNFKIEHIFDY